MVAAETCSWVPHLDASWELGWVGSLTAVGAVGPNPCSVPAQEQHELSDPISRSSGDLTTVWLNTRPSWHGIVKPHNLWFSCHTISTSVYTYQCDTIMGDV